MKIAAVAALMFVSGNINAQDEFGPKKGDFGTEVQFNPFSNNFQTFKIDGLNFRYFISAEHAIRLGLNVSVDNKNNGKSLIAPVRDDYANEALYTAAYENYEHGKDYKNKVNNTNFGINLGYEYHFAKFGRADLYAGAQVAFAFNNWKQTINEPESYKLDAATGKSNWTVLTDELKGAADTDGDDIPDEFSAFGFGAGVFTGIDFYITKNLYVGAELGINFKTAKAKNYDSTVQWLEHNLTNDTYNVKSQTTTVENNVRETTLKFEAVPALRLGWTF